MDLKNTKIWIGNDECLNKKVQEKLFELGVAWGGSGKEVCNTHGDSLFVDSVLHITYANSGENYFKNKSEREVTVKELLSGKIPKAKPEDLHIILNESRGNLGIFKSYQEAEDKAKTMSERVTIYKLLEKAKVTSERKVVRVRK